LDIGGKYISALSDIKSTFNRSVNSLRFQDEKGCWIVGIVTDTHKGNAVNFDEDALCEDRLLVPLLPAA
jgi:hypothetical protein